MSRRCRNVGRQDGNGWNEWGGYMNAKKQKLQEQFEQETPGQLKKEGSGSKIFAGISIHVNGYTKPSSDELKRLMMLHGGNYEHYLYRTRVTHVIATNLPNSKVKELKGLKVVRPEWITDSISAGRLLSYTNYLLYTAQTGGIQKGLKSYASVQLNDNQSTADTQSRKVGAQSDSTSDYGAVADNSTDSTAKTGSVKVCDKLNLDHEHDAQSNQFSDHTAVGSNAVDERADVDDELFEIHNESKKISRSVPIAKAGDPKFLNEFYSNSRLHFLSTWKAEWKSYVNELQSKGDNFPGREKLRKIASDRVLSQDAIAENSGKKRCVMHIDMDCFFVSVGLRKRPDLRGKPVAVTHSRGKGAKPDPQSDLNYERQQWEQKLLQGGKKGRRRTGDIQVPRIQEGDTSFPDISDSDDSENDDVIDDVIDVAKATTESFHSMAEIASCSYEARKAGVKNGMFMGRAKSICPELVTIPYDFDGYKSVSRILYDTVASYTHDIEAVSCDEMLIDCTDLLRNTGATPLEFSTLLRSEIFEKTSCPASAGIGSSILLARMATRKAKPNGQFYLTQEMVSDYIKSQPVKDLPGVGRSFTRRFEALKVSTCGDLQRISLESLKNDFGPKTGQSLYRYCRGLDDRPIKMEQERKSVSAEVNYGIRFTSDSEAVKFMEELSSEVCSRLKSIKMKGKTVTLKLMVRRKDAPKETSKFMGHGICNNFSKSVTLPLATDEARIISKETVGLLRQHKVDPGDLRGIGIQVQKLEPAEIGIMGTSKKLPSILDYTVNKKMTSSETKGGNLSPAKSVQHNSIHRDENSKARPAADKNGTLNESRPGTSTEDSLGVNNLQGTIVTKFSGTRNFNSTESVKSDEKSKQNVSMNITGHVHNEFNSDVDTNSFSVTSSVDVTRSMDDDLVADLARRLQSSSQLPPLPCLPDIKTPESAKKVVHMNTPEVLSSQQDVDYFPSPSQVDLQVLRELPVEIRQQIENEIGNRRRKKMVSTATTHVTSISEAGCSHWQQDRGGNSENENQIKGDNKSEDIIVALPSPSQIDPSCLEALPESMQAELRLAYAKQDSNRRVSVKGGNTLQLQQAKSPVKSPGKSRRSPGKKSPNFKVPRGRPSGRGRKKTTSKKTLFKDQGGLNPQISTTSNSCFVSKTSKGIPTVASSSDILKHRPEGDTDLCFESTGNKETRIVIDIDEDVEIDTNSTDIDTDTGKFKQQCDNVDDGDDAISDENVVSLCGAVTLVDVKSLVKEWISSTTVPQEEDEEVLIKYLHGLVINKNLEYVDRILKFMLRCINSIDNFDWLGSLRRVYTYVQMIVYQIYGSRLGSITI